ncbi:MAG TPA: DNA translocase FtsK 4TM domain-containing protein [Acidimicrobiia bacterium]|nr:DNA translocase FtsK 4TM domain-containing protein [Acidimicrobiia bacterium]
MATRRGSKSSRARSSKRAKSKKRRPQGRGRVAVRAAWRDDFNEQLQGHRSDALALLFGVAGVIAALGIYSDLAGPFGRAIDTGTAAILGGGRFLVPFALMVGALALIVPVPAGVDDEDEEEETGGRGWRLGVGLVATLLAVVGLLHVGHGNFHRSLHELERAGGAVGALVGAPLRAGLGPAGAVIVLGALGCLGVLLMVGVGLRQVGHGVAIAARFIGYQAGALLTMRQDTPPVDDELDLVAAEDAGATGAHWPEPALVAELVDEDEEEEEYEEEDDEEYEAEDEEYEEEEDDDEEEEEYEEEDEDDAAAAEVEQLSIHLPPGHRLSPWKLPPANVLKRSESSKVDPQLVQEGGEVLEATMRQFGVDARLLGATVGPTVTRYELELAPGVKVNKVTSLAKEIAYSMASHDVRILAPIPGRSAIGVEVPNKMRPIVTLGDILASPEAKKAKHPLEVAMGRDIAGNAVMANLATFPHVLIAGQTGAGKSSCINSIVTSLLVRTTPDQVRLILVDPKRVELGQYNSVPHLLTEVVTNPKRAANALDWVVREMEMRYELLGDIGVRDITGYNTMFDQGDLPTSDDPDPETGKSYERLPFIVVVVDELADLMMVAARDVETSICRIAQMARAVGIHLVIATQRPSVDVITGVIKANIPSRLAFSVSTLADSRVILDQMGAEKLIGKGDMLMLAASSSRTERIQGAWVDEECVRKVVAHWRRQVTESTYVEGVQGADGANGGRGRSEDDESDDLLGEAMDLVVRAGMGSTSMLQRKLRVGFARAGRLMDLLERRGVVGPSEGSKARSVLMSIDELEEMSTR